MTGTLGQGNDVVVAGAQLAFLNGGSGTDSLTLDYSGALEDGRTATRLNFSRLETTSVNEQVVLSDNSVAEFSIRGFESFNITGTDGDDIINAISGTAGNTLVGGKGNDRLIGGSGVDLIDGGEGDDITTGGAGNDIFVKRAGESNDTITDFQKGVDADSGDKIDVSSYGLSFAAITFEAEAGGLRIRIGADSILLQGSGLSELDETDFIGLTVGNTPPSASAIDAGSVSEDGSAVEIDLLGDAGASDSDGGTLGVTSVSAQDQNGAAVSFGLVGAFLSIDPGQFAETLSSGESATVTVSYSVTDGQGGETPNTATLVVDGLDGPFTWYLDRDSDGFGVDDAATNQSAYAAPAGTSGIAGDADDADDTVYPGAPEINDLKDNDQDGLTDEDNTAPVADAETFEIAEDGTLVLPVSALLDGDTDVDGDTLTVASVSDAVNGTVALDTKGDADPTNDEVIFTPDAGYDGPASFDYTVADGFGGEDTEAVDVTVTTAPNVPPTASVIDAGVVSEDGSSVEIDLLGDAGASDSDGGTLGVTSVSAQDQNGAAVSFGLVGAFLSIDPGQFAETLSSGESATVTVSYSVTDGQGGETPNTATLVVDGLDGPFTWYVDGDGDGFGVDAAATNQSAYAAPGGTSGVAGDADDADDTVYPDAPEINDFKDNDQDGLIDEDNTAPVADAETFEIAEDGTQVLPVSSLLDGDTDVDGDTLTVASVSDAVNGTVALDTKGDADPTNDEVIFTPDAGYDGPASFDYTVADGFGGEDTETVDVTVIGASVPNNGGKIGGGKSGDILIGTGADEKISGGSGNDLINGGGGSDNLRGGKGIDVFWFTPDPGTDEVSDFARGEDLLDLRSVLGVTEHEDVFAFYDTNSDGQIDEADAYSFESRQGLVLELDGDMISGNSSDEVLLKKVEDLTISDFGDYDFL